LKRNYVGGYANKKRLNTTAIQYGTHSLYPSCWTQSNPLHILLRMTRFRNTGTAFVSGTVQRYATN
jgi:hypothetical protein